MKRIGIVHILAGLIVKLFLEGKTKIGRTELGGMLENHFPKNGFGHKLTDWITEACTKVPGTQVIREGKHVFVVKA